MSEQEPIEGWGWPLFAAKPHYFRDGRSLCGKWTFGYRTDLTSGRGRGEFDCAQCQRKLALVPTPPMTPVTASNHH